LIKKNINTIVWQAAVVLISLDLFYWFNHLSKSQIKFLLDFYKKFPEIFFGHLFWYNEVENWHSAGRYVISKECLGLNIIVLIFGLCGVMNIGKLKGYKKPLWILTSAVLAILFGVFANILRLLSSVYFTAYANFNTIHTMLGIVIYLSAIIFCYVFFKRIKIKENGGSDNYEKHI